jgi:hypothetical protein
MEYSSKVPSNSSEYFLFLFEPTSIAKFLDGSSSPVYSHDLNLMQLAQASINMGIETLAASYDDQFTTYSITSGWPVVELNKGSFGDKHFPTFVFAANHLAFDNRRRELNGPKNVLVKAAIHLVEQPGLYFPNGTATFMNTFRNVVDFVITQNERMADVLRTMMLFTVGYKDEGRILISKLAAETHNPQIDQERRAVARSTMGFKDTDVVILNAGGAWKWTQFNEFLLAFADALQVDGYENLYLIQPSLSQKNNSEHYSYNLETRRLYDSLPKHIQSRIYLGSDWDTEATKLESYLAAADFGLSINLDSLEQWQSYRVRVLEYISSNLPIIMSRGTFWDESEARNLFVFTGHTKKDFLETLTSLPATEKELFDFRYNLRADFEKLQENLSLKMQAERVIRELISHEARFESPKFSEAIIWDYRNAGPNSGISIQRFLIRIYFMIVKNSFFHSILVLTGVRFIFRQLKKLRT